MEGKQEVDKFIRDRFQDAKSIDEGCLGTDVTFFGASLIGQPQQLDCIAVAEPIGAYAGWQMVAVLKQDPGQVPDLGNPGSVELFLIGEGGQLEFSADFAHFRDFEYANSVPRPAQRVAHGCKGVFLHTSGKPLVLRLGKAATDHRESFQRNCRQIFDYLKMIARGGGAFPARLIISSRDGFECYFGIERGGRHVWQTSS